MAWVYIFFAGLLEIGWALGLKASEGFTRPLPTVFTLIAAALSFWLLALAMRDLPAGTAYAVWSGIGAFGTVVLGIVLFQDAVSAPRLLCLGLILAGIIGLKMFSS
ncbi:multidrug efflux SMR transporter [Alcanivorax sp. DP30]|uniref:DMT family transporter n=1 Tax=Alcanivorax sp. DP30 TaxID=2606217 RepID=UPI00136952C1|nr:multidrug efflux SMR transporter [Alcanivorax sp. DP30]MZR62226.1 QacE family quaternary ammonium compound efflux SMR transporter [Alcanivorax sp. DP30]